MNIPTVIKKNLTEMNQSGFNRLRTRTRTRITAYCCFYLLCNYCQLSSKTDIYV